MQLQPILSSVPEAAPNEGNSLAKEFQEVRHVLSVLIIMMDNRLASFGRGYSYFIYGHECVLDCFMKLQLLYFMMQRKQFHFM